MLLERAIETVLEESHETLVPMKSRMPNLRKSLDEVISGNLAAVAMGTFYENLTNLFFGGLLRTSPRVREFAGSEIIPDIVNFKTKEVFESKAVNRRYHCNVTYTQLDGYGDLQSDHPDYSINFVIYRHGLNGIKSGWNGPRGDLFKELASGTLYAVVLPLCLILNMYANSPPSVTDYKNADTCYSDCMCIRSPWLCAVFENPQKELQKHGFEESGQNISRTLTPERKVYGFHLKQFPLVVIEDLDNSWRNNLQQEKLDEVPF